jgi:glutamine amidotransferase
MITVIDYGAGNIQSVLRACAEVGEKVVRTGDPAVVARATKIIFPGVGAAPSAMAYLHDMGLDEALKKAVRAGVPVLGICLGAQIVLDRSEEGGQPCLGLIPGATVRFRPPDGSYKIPHIGWNDVRVTRPHPLLDGLQPGDEFYFVHSYYPRPASDSDVYAVSDHGEEFCAAIGRDNLFATQFHPEKSGRKGLELLARFQNWDGTVKQKVKVKSQR